MTRPPLLALLLLFAPIASATEVLASIRPLALIAEAVVAEPAQVRRLLPDGASAHHPALRPSDRQALFTADIVLRIGPAHDAFLDRAMAGRMGVVIEAQSLPGMTLKTQRQRDGSPLARAATDPHLWLHPDNAVVIARALAGVLAELDPDRATRYHRNAEDFAGRVRALKTELARATPPRAYVAYHDAYQYLEPLLALRYRGSLTLDAESKPGARHFQWMSTRIREEKITCLLAEPGFDAALVQRVAAGQSLRMVPVDEMFTAAPLKATGYEEGLRQAALEISRCTSRQQ